MIWLVLGVLVWSGVHVLPCSGASARQRLVERLGEGPYKGLFSLALVGSIVLMVIGWRSSVPHPVYTTPGWSAPVANVLMVLALLLFAASGVPTNLKRVLRHPQLTGFALWAGAHLLANGDRRSLVLFGGLGLWALLSIVLLNRRDGDWTKPEPQPWSAELKPVVGAAVVFVALFFAHGWLFGVSPLPG